MLPRLQATHAEFQDQLERLKRKLSPDGSIVSPRSRELTLKLFGSPLTPQQVVERICTEVRDRGKDAVLHYARCLDDPKADAASIRVPATEIERAHRSASPELLQAIRRIRDNVSRFQSAILHRDVEVSSVRYDKERTQTDSCQSTGIRLRQRYVPLQRIGICVPGGAAAYPSTLLMTAIPAQCAGVKEIAVVAPPTIYGAYNSDVLATCHELGIGEVYAVGGAQGVASLAYGIEGIQPVDKIVGPGNLFVALAKRFVYGQVDIDSIAGPSEVLVIADKTTRPAYAASDLIAQAEHSPGSSIVLSAHQEMLDAIDDAIQHQLQSLERGALALESLKEFGASILCIDEEQVIDLANAFAPEHLQISVDEPVRFAARIRNAGAQFLGHYTPVALGDYAAGPSHVLPTGATARWASGLNANHFLRSFSETQFDLEALRQIEPSVTEMANREGLTAHRESVRIRIHGAV